MSKQRSIILSVAVEGRSQAETARRFGVSEAWVSILMARWRAEGEAAFEPKSRRPRTSPSKTPPGVVDKIVKLRDTLVAQGLDRQDHAITHRRAPDIPPFALQADAFAFLEQCPMSHERQTSRFLTRGRPHQEVA